MPRNILTGTLLLFMLHNDSLSQNFVNQSILINSENITFEIGSTQNIYQLVAPDILKGQDVRGIIVWQYKDDHEVFKSTLHTYNSHGICVSRLTYGIDYKTLWRYDKHLLLSEVIDSTRSRMRSHIRLEYERDSLLRIVRKLNISLYDSCKTCSYFSEQVPMSIECADSCIFSDDLYSYDSQSNLTQISKKIFYQDNKCEIVRHNFIYNSNGKLIEKSIYSHTYKYTYNKKGYLKKRVELYSSGQVAEGVYFRYDSRGRLKSQLSLKGKYGELTEYTYADSDLILTWTLTTVRKKFIGIERNKIRFRRFLEYTY